MAAKGKSVVFDYTGFEPLVKSCTHYGKPIEVGNCKIGLGARRDLYLEDLYGADVLIPLGVQLPGTAPASTMYLEAVLGTERTFKIWECPWRDYGPPPQGFGDFLRQKVIPALEDGVSVLAFCEGGHGRTGTLLASLIAIMEPETKDPIAAARERYCKFAIESEEQVESIFALRDQAVPSKYRKRKSSAAKPAKLAVARKKA